MSEVKQNRPGRPSIYTPEERKERQREYMRNYMRDYMRRKYVPRKNNVDKFKKDIENYNVEITNSRIIAYLEKLESEILDAKKRLIANIELIAEPSDYNYAQALAYASNPSSGSS